MAYVYCLVWNDPKCRLYIGSTKNLQVRVDRHNSQLSRGVHPNNHMQRLYNNGWSFDVVVLDKDLPTASQLDVEQLWLDGFDCVSSSAFCNQVEARGGTTTNVKATISVSLMTGVTRHRTQTEASEFSRVPLTSVSACVNKRIKSCREWQFFSADTYHPSKVDGLLLVDYKRKWDVVKAPKTHLYKAVTATHIKTGVVVKAESVRGLAKLIGCKSTGNISRLLND